MFKTFAVAVLFAAVISAAPLPLGCFRKQDLMGFKAFRSWYSATPATCERMCSFTSLNIRYPLSAVGPGSVCYCGATIPSDSLQLANQAICGGNRGGLLVHYSHNVTGESCETNPVDLDLKKWAIAYLPANVKMDPASRTMTLAMGNGQGTRVMHKEVYRYGMYQYYGKVSCQNGVVSAFYLSNDPANLHTSQHEIDVEYINGWPSGNRSNPLPGSLWTHSYIDGKSQKEKMIVQDSLRQKLVAAGSSSGAQFSTCEWQQWAFDWQPTYLRWYANGVLVDERNWGEKLTRGRTFVTPYKPQSIMMTVWTMTDKPQWGGQFVLNPQSPAASSFRDITRITCGKLYSNYA